MGKSNSGKKSSNTGRCTQSPFSSVHFGPCYIFTATAASIDLTGSGEMARSNTDDFYYVYGYFVPPLGMKCAT